MAMATKARDEDVMVDINTTPLIDVMLVLLIMLLVTIPMQMHAIKLDMPQANQPPPLVPPPVVRIDIDFDDTISWNGTVVADRAGLERALSTAAAEDPQPEIHLAPDKLATYGPVAMVLAEARRHCLVKIGIVGAEQFLQ